MTAPSAVELLILILGAGRILRLAGWDEFPLAVKVRAWATGEHWIPCDEQDEGAQKIGLPGKQPHSEVDYVRPAYDRPTLSHLIRCPFCFGFYVSLATALAWWAAPSWTLAALFPFALSNVVGLIAKNLDA